MTEGTSDKRRWKAQFARLRRTIIIVSASMWKRLWPSGLLCGRGLEMLQQDSSVGRPAAVGWLCSTPEATDAVR